MERKRETGIWLPCTLYSAPELVTGYSSPPRRVGGIPTSLFQAVLQSGSGFAVFSAELPVLFVQAI